MKHDSDILKRIKAYFMRRKSANEAYAFEREMERDSFLYDAVDGLEDLMTSDIQQAMDELDDMLEAHSKTTFFNLGRLAIIGIILLVSFGIYIFMPVDQESAPRQVEIDQPEEKYAPRSRNVHFNQMKDTNASIKSKEDTALSKEAISPQPTRQEAKNPEPRAASKPITQDKKLAANQGKDKAIEPTEKRGENIKEPAMTKVDTSNEVKVKENEVVESPAKPPVDPVTTELTQYKAYLKKNLQKSSGMPSGTVLVSFELDRNGRPKKANIEKTLCTACDAEALRLIQNGPTLQNQDRKERITVEVHF